MENRTEPIGIGHGLKHTRAQLLTANEDAQSAVKKELSPPIVGANVIRILPYSVHLRTVCLRFELHGCPYDGKSNCLPTYKSKSKSKRDPLATLLLSERCLLSQSIRLRRQNRPGPQSRHSRVGTRPTRGPFGSVTLGPGWCAVYSGTLPDYVNAACSAACLIGWRAPLKAIRQLLCKIGPLG